MKSLAKNHLNCQIEVSREMHAIISKKDLEDYLLHKLSREIGSEIANRSIMQLTLGSYGPRYSLELFVFSPEELHELLSVPQDEIDVLKQVIRCRQREAEVKG